MKHRLFSLLAVCSLGAAALGEMATDSTKPTDSSTHGSAGHAEKKAPAATPAATPAVVNRRRHVEMSGTSLVTGQGGIMGGASGTAAISAAPGIKFAHSAGAGSTLSTGQGGITTIHFGQGDAAPGTVLSTGQGGFTVQPPSSNTSASGR